MQSCMLVVILPLRFLSFFYFIEDWKRFFRMHINYDVVSDDGQWDNWKLSFVLFFVSPSLNGKSILGILLRHISEGEKKLSVSISCRWMQSRYFKVRKIFFAFHKVKFVTLKNIFFFAIKKMNKRNLQCDKERDEMYTVNNFNVI